MQLVRDLIASARAAPWFTLALLLTLAAAGFNGLMVILMALRLTALLPGPFAQMAHFTEPAHRVHDLTFSFLFLPAIFGVLTQLRRPAANIAAMWMALVPSAALLLTLLVTIAVGGNVSTLQPPWLTVAAGVLMTTALHPAGGALLRAFRISRVTWPLLGLVVLAALPPLPFAATNIGLQATVNDEHAAAGHYGFMAAFAFTVIGLGLLASLRPRGWRLTGWVAGLLPVLLGAASLIYPDASSALDVTLALGAIGWGGIFLVATALTPETGLAEAPGGAAPRRSGGWRIAAVVLGLLILVIGAIGLMAGGHGPGQIGPGQHGPGGIAPAPDQAAISFRIWSDASDRDR